MKKIILSLALITSGFFAFNASAQQTKTPPCCKPNAECCTPGADCCQNGKKAQAPKFNPFEGITLTADQQSKIDKLNEKVKADRQKAKQERKENAQKARKDGKAAKQEYLNELKRF